MNSSLGMSWYLRTYRYPARHSTTFLYRSGSVCPDCGHVLGVAHVVAHVLVRRVPAVKRRDAVATGLRSGDRAVAVVGIQSQCVRFWGGSRGVRDLLLPVVKPGILQHGGVFPVWFGIAGSVTRKVKGVGSAEVIS